MVRVFSRWLILALLAVAVAGCGGGYHTEVLDTPGTQHLKGHQRPYAVNGQVYRPLSTHHGFVEEGIASWYGKDFHGRKTSNGEIYDMYAMTAAHKTLPLGVDVKVHNLSNGRETVVRVNDRGPFVAGRIIDLSYTAAKELGVVGPGTAPVRIEALGYRSLSDGGEVAYTEPRSYDVGSYAVQVGSFSMAGNAERLASKLRTTHGDALVSEGVVNGKRFYRVWAGRYGSVLDAEAARDEFSRLGYDKNFVVAID